MSTREHPETDRALEQRAKELLDASAAELDAATRARLAVARERALEAAAQTHRPALGSRGLVPAGAAAIAIVAAALWWLAREPQPDAVGQVVAFNELELLLEIDLLEDPEFYDWLAQQPELVAGGDGTG